MRRGYTLVELLLVIVLLTVMAGVIWTARSNTLQTRALNNDAGSMLSLMREGRVIAVARSTRAKLVHDTALRQVRLEILEDPLENPEGFTAPKGVRGEAVSLDDEVVVEMTHRDTGAAVEEVIFYPDGRADPIDVMLSHARVKEKLQIRVNRLTGIAHLTEVLE